MQTIGKTGVVIARKIRYASLVKHVYPEIFMDKRFKRWQKDGRPQGATTPSAPPPSLLCTDGARRIVGTGVWWGGAPCGRPSSPYHPKMRYG